MDSLEARYTRQESLHIVQQQTVAIIGAGGIGSWLALYLGMAGINCLHLYDPDNVEEHNLNRLPVPPEAVGQNKAQAVRTEVLRLNPEITCYAHPIEWSEPSADRAEPDYLVCCTDNLKSRKAVHAYAQKEGLHYLELGADGNHATLTGTPPDWSTPEEQNPGYRSVPVFVGPCAAIAALATYYILRYEEPTILARIDWTDSILRLGSVIEKIRDNEEDADGTEEEAEESPEGS
jgi:molybdopterin/thiamine biosynthesis adenylyltransferase